MTEKTIIALQAFSYIMAEDDLRDRFITLSGMDPAELKSHVQEIPFLVSVLEFLIMHEPDLLAFACASNIPPELVVRSWRNLGGGVGQEW